MTIPEISRNGYDHIEFKRIDMDDGSRKTSIWGCYNKKSGDSLGFVKWHGAWRQYCFFAGGPPSYRMVILSRSCMDDIQDFINNLMKAREATRQGKATAWLGDQYLGSVSGPVTEWKTDSDPVKDIQNFDSIVRGKKCPD